MMRIGHPEYTFVMHNKDAHCIQLEEIFSEKDLGDTERCKFTRSDKVAAERYWCNFTPDKGLQQKLS